MDSQTCGLSLLGPTDVAIVGKKKMGNETDPEVIYAHSGSSGLAKNLPNSAKMGHVTKTLPFPAARLTQTNDFSLRRLKSSY
jgi:hypothetical protein